MTEYENESTAGSEQSPHSSRMCDADSARSASRRRDLTTVSNGVLEITASLGDMIRRELQESQPALEELSQIVPICDLHVRYVKHCTQLVRLQQDMDRNLNLSQLRSR